MSKIAEVDGNGKMLLDCQKSEYIDNLIGLTKKAQTEGNKHMIRVYANELEKYKTLCGSHPLLEQFERQLSFTADKLGLSTCPAIQRALAPANQSTKPAQRSLGFGNMLDSAFGTLTKEEPLQPPVGAMSGFQRQLECSEFGGSQNTLERIHQPPKSPERLLGFGGMLTAAFGSQQQERSLDTSNAHPQKRNALNMGWGFRSMLNGAFPTSKPTEERVKIFKTGDRLRSMVGFTEVELIVTPKGIVRTFKE